MRQIEGGIQIPAGETVWLKPGGLHLMLMKPSVALIEGKKQFVTLEFENAGHREAAVRSCWSGRDPKAERRAASQS